MEKPVLSPDFTVEDIHKLREYNYYLTKDMTLQEQMGFYNTRGLKVHQKIQDNKMRRQNHLCQNKPE